MATEPSGRQALAAVMFLQAGMTVFDTYSTLNSSPWTAENVGADERKAASLREYVAHAAVVSTAFCVGASVIGGSAWPLAGALAANGYLVWIYSRAMQRAADAGDSGAGWFGTWGGGGSA